MFVVVVMKKFFAQRKRILYHALKHIWKINYALRDEEIHGE